MSDLVKNPEFRQAMLANPNLILVGYNLSEIGVKSVLCDYAMAARMAYTLLQQAGHEKIGLVITNISHPVSQQIISGWRSCLVGVDRQYESCGLIDLGTKDISRSIEKFFTEIIRQSTMPFSAIITSSPEIGIEFCKALDSVGLAVPADISVLTLGLGEYLPHYTPKLHCIDPHLDRQVEYAVDCSLKMLKGKSSEMLHLVPPEIFNGESLKVVQTENFYSRRKNNDKKIRSNSR